MGGRATAGADGEYRWPGSPVSVEMLTLRPMRVWCGRSRGELLSFKQFAASTIPANLSDAEAEARHGCTLRKRSCVAHVWVAGT